MNRADNVLDALTWHHYYLDGHQATLEDFLKIETLNSFQDQMDTVKDYLYNVIKMKKDLWLGETSSAYGGGVKGVSDRYAAGFLWLDKLGLAAVNKYKVVIRQTFYHGAYALIGEDLKPNPDYWVSLVYKKLVGIRVLRVTNHDSDKIRLYAHCTNGANNGSVTLFGLNLNDEFGAFRLKQPLSQSTIWHYVLSAENFDLTTRTILLNQKPLMMESNSDLPPLIPRITPKSNFLLMKPYEMAFWVFPEARAKACIKKYKRFR